MGYTTRNNVLTFISAPALTKHLDDDLDGTEDAGLLDTIIAACSLECDSRLGSIFTVPFQAPYPPRVAAATLIFVCEALYSRRLIPDEHNPFKARADVQRKELTMIGKGELNLDGAHPRSFYQGNAILTEALTNGSTM